MVKSVRGASCEWPTKSYEKRWFVGFEFGLRLFATTIDLDAFSISAVNIETAEVRCKLMYLLQMLRGTIRLVPPATDVAQLRARQVQCLGGGMDATRH